MNPFDSEPLTEARVVRVLDALEEFGGDHLMFMAAANQLKLARMTGRAPAPDPAADAVDEAQLGDDLGRLQMIWMMAGAQLMMGDPDAAMGVFATLASAYAADLADGEEEDEDDGPWSAEATADNMFGSFTRDEMAAIAAHADRVAFALSPERSGAMAGIEAEFEATRANATRIDGHDPEAREWLRANGQDAPLAGNRFDAGEARAFVEELYAAGARRVVISADSIRDDAYELSHGGPYADALKVELPRDPAQRAAIFAISAREAGEEGLDPDEDIGQDVLFFWWD